jgi:hypothetical protein
MRAHEIGAGDRGQLSAPLVQLRIDVAERLEPRPETGTRPPRSLGDGTDPPFLLREEMQDAVGLPEAEGAQHHCLRPVGPRAHPASVEMSKGEAPRCPSPKQPKAGFGRERPDRAAVTQRGRRPQP